jgi:hypothetical protein
VLYRALPHSQTLGNDPCWKPCLLEGEHLLIACFTRRLARPRCRRGNENGFGWHLGFASSFGQLFPARRNHLIQMFRQIFRYVPAIGHVLGMGKSFCDSGCKLLTAVPRHDVDGWVAFQPVDDRRLRAIGQQGNRLGAFQIHDKSPIALAALPGPLVETNDLWRSDGGEGKGMHEAQDRSRSHLHALESGAACS